MASDVIEVTRGQDESSPTTKSKRCRVRINIHSKKVKEIEERSGHFSIRGFVAEVRKRNPKLCDPFSLHGLDQFKEPRMLHHKHGCNGKNRVVKVDNGGENTSSWYQKLHDSQAPVPHQKGKDIAEQHAANRESPPKGLSDRVFSSKEGSLHETIPKRASVDDQRKDALINYKETKVAGLIEEPRINNLHPSPLPNSNECTPIASNEHNEALQNRKNQSFDPEDDYFGCCHGEKPRKMRLLSEILAVKEDKSSKTSVFACREPMGREKRKNSLNEGSRSTEIRGSSNMKRRVMILETETSESESEGSEYIGVISKSVTTKCHKKKHERNIKQRQKTKKITVDQAPKESNGKGKSTEKSVDYEVISVHKTKERLASTATKTKTDETTKKKSYVMAWKNRNRDECSAPRRDRLNQIREVNEQGHALGDENLMKKHEAIRTEGETSILPNTKSLEIQVPPATRLKETSTDAPRRVKDIDINALPVDDRAMEEGLSEEGIPEDIVELMARNQYERHLNVTNEEISPLPPNSRKKIATMSTNDVNEDRVLQVGQAHSLGTQNPQQNEARNTILNGIRYACPSKKNMLGSFSETRRDYFDIGCRPIELQLAPRFSGLAQEREQLHVCSSPGLSAKGWIGNDASHMTRDWHSLMPNCVAPPGSLKGGNPLKVKGSIDLNSNEVIPAMQLLCLMQNQAQMSPTVPFTLEGKTDFIKRTSNLPNQQCKAGANPRDPLYNNNVQASLSGISCPRQPSLASVRPLASSFPNEPSLGTSNGYLTPFPSKFTIQGNTERSHVSSTNGNNISQKKLSCDIIRRKRAVSALDKGKGTAKLGRPVKRKVGFEGETLICSLNRNPAEITNLKLARKYTIGAKNLKPKKYQRKAVRPRSDSHRAERI